MVADKQLLLKRHRRRKRIGAAIAAAGIATAALIAWWLPLPLTIIAWVAHEAWFADHQFYVPDQDYHYGFPGATQSVPVTLGEQGELILTRSVALEPGDTLLLEVGIKATWLGGFRDPAVVVTSGAATDSQAFERHVRGRRYVNLTGLASAVTESSLRVTSRYCRVENSGQLWVFRHPDYLNQRVLIIAPHADDAELAAFGLYSQASESWIVTLTAGEVEAGHYRRMGCSATEAALLKGRLRAWDSVTVPRWGGVAERNCLQLGYFCLQLPAMQVAPDQPAGSREADLRDTRLFRRYNQLSLPSDGDGLPTWHNLKNDLLHVVDLVRPEIIVLPHPHLDPHPDHVCAWQLVAEVLAASVCHPAALLCYANHLHDNDRWPMGNAHSGVPLPPKFAGEVLGTPYCLVATEPVQRDKAMALGMMHDLQTPLSFKQRLRRRLQSVLAGRQWPPYGENEFFRKAVRRHELFWVQAPPPHRPEKVCEQAGRVA